MKKLSTIGLALACCLLLAQPVQAAIDIGVNAQVGNVVSFTWPANHSSSGGPFLGNISGDTWRTFCVESDGGSELINPNGTPYYVTSITANVAAATGNVATAAAKYLYYAYGHDLLTLGGSGAAYSDTAAKNESLQQAIWSLVIKRTPAAPANPVGNYAYTGGIESLYDFLDVGGLSADAAAWRAFAVAAVTGGDAANLALADRIYVLNPDATYPASGEQAQSMLFEVPEPTSIAVWSVLAGGAAGLSVAKRRRRNTSAGRWSSESRSAIFAVVENGKAHH